MAGIVESQEAESATLGLGVEGGRLGRFHVGAIAAEPNDARSCRSALARGGERRYAVDSGHFPR